jgi:hypothetical protein
VGYRIDFGIDLGAGGRTLQAKVRGRSARQAERIGRDIADQADREAAQQVLIDVRGLADRLGALGSLALAACRDRRVAIIDSHDNQLYHPFSEFEARLRGFEVRYFSDAAAAMAWLDESRRDS